MTDKELLKALQPLEKKMQQFSTSKSGYLTPEDLGIIRKTYPDMQQRALGNLGRVFNTSCSACIRDVFSVYCSWYFREKEKHKAPIKAPKKK